MRYRPPCNPSKKCSPLNVSQEENPLELLQTPFKHCIWNGLRARPAARPDKSHICNSVKCRYLECLESLLCPWQQGPPPRGEAQRAGFSNTHWALPDSSKCGTRHPVVLEAQLLPPPRISDFPRSPM